MKLYKQIFNFLAGIHFAIFLIAVAALTVIVGTFLESYTDSHLMAAQWTYANPFFMLLLSLFFVNILFSALRRWPFKKRHIPFLITHLGLLMMISGTILKNRIGLQGQLSVWEGSGNQQVMLPHTYALSLEAKEPDLNITQNSLILLDSFQPHIYYPFHFPQLKCKIVSYAPHVKEHLETWIKGSQAYIAGFPPLPVQEWKSSQAFPEGSVHLYKMTSPSLPWSILPLRTTHVSQAFRNAYLQQLTMRLKAKDGTMSFLEIPVIKALEQPFVFASGTISTTLQLSYPILEEQNATLNILWQSSDGNQTEHLTLALQGQDALIVQTDPIQWTEGSFTIDLVRPHLTLCLVDDEQENVHLFAFDCHGRLHAESFNAAHLGTFLSYDQGFSGYGVQAHIPFPSFPSSRENKERAYANELILQLQHALAQNPPLTPPLRFFEKACQQAQVEFSKNFTEFLTEWNAQGGFLFHPHRSLPTSLQTVLTHLDWKEVSLRDQQITQWTTQLLDQLEHSLKQGESPLKVLERLHWPYLAELQDMSQQTEKVSLCTKLAQQVATLVDHLPTLHFPIPLTISEHTLLLSAYFRAYAIDYSSLFPLRGSGQEQFDSLENDWKTYAPENQAHTHFIAFETPLTHHLVPETSPSKLEERCPGIILEVQQGLHKQTIALAYDSTATSLKWPLLNGDYLIRFQPQLRELPYRIRLRQAREISYPQSSQAYSYESDVLISEKGQAPIAQTLSMNQVYETWDGYRFYLAGVGTSSETRIKRIQLAVNHDPAKYILTYPGAVFIFSGIILLFWIYPSRKK